MWSICVDARICAAWCRCVCWLLLYSDHVVCLQAHRVLVCGFWGSAGPVAKLALFCPARQSVLLLCMMLAGVHMACWLLCLVALGVWKVLSSEMMRVFFVS